MPLALAINNGRASGSHLIQSCRVVCAYSMFCNIATHARLIASESDPADALARQTWTDAAPCEEGLTTKARITPARFWPHRALPRRATLYQKTNPHREATSLTYAKSTVFIYVVSVQACEAPLRSKRRSRSHGPPRKWMELTSYCARQLFPFVGLKAMVTTAFYAHLRPFALTITIGFFQVTGDSANWPHRCSTPCGRQVPLFRSQLCTRSRRTRPLSLPTSLFYSRTFHLHCDASQRHPSRRGTLFTAPRRSVARRPNGPQKPGSDQNARTVAADCSIQRYKKTTRALQRVAMLAPRRGASGLTIAKSRRTLFERPALTPTHAKRWSWQLPCKHSLWELRTTPYVLSFWPSLATDGLGGHAGGLPPCLFR